MSSIEIAQQILQMEPSKTTILIGSSKNVLPLAREDRFKMAELMFIPISQAPVTATFTKKCLNKECGCDGTVFSVEDNVIIEVNGQEVVVKLHSFLSVYRCGNQHDLLGKGVYFEPQLLDTGQKETNFWSGFHKVKSQPVRNQIFFKVESICRKVILYPTDNNSLIVVDYMRDARYLSSVITVPVYPQVGDMLLIQGQLNNEIWYGHAQDVDYLTKTVDVFFYIESPRLTHSNQHVFVRETPGRRARNTVQWESLIGVAEGQWSSHSTWMRTV